MIGLFALYTDPHDSECILNMEFECGVGRVGWKEKLILRGYKRNLGGVAGECRQGLLLTTLVRTGWTGSRLNIPWHGSIHQSMPITASLA